jgi:hypothetical protein
MPHWLVALIAVGAWTAVIILIAAVHHYGRKRRDAEDPGRRTNTTDTERN